MGKYAVPGLRRQVAPSRGRTARGRAEGNGGREAREARHRCGGSGCVLAYDRAMSTSNHNPRPLIIIINNFPSLPLSVFFSPSFSPFFNGSATRCFSSFFLSSFFLANTILR